MAPPRKSERLAKELAFYPASKRLKEWHISAHILRHLCRLADDFGNDGNHNSLAVARLCCRIAARLKTEGAIARSFARLASALRQANRLGHAEEALKIALSKAPDELKADLFRRRSYLRMYQGRIDEATHDAEAAVEGAIGSEHARALEALGFTFYYRGDYKTAIQKFELSLEETDPDAGVRYCNLLHNYASALAHGTDKEAAKAMKLCGELRPKLKDRHKMQRAKLWWIEGLLHERLGDLDGKAWWALNVAKRSLIALKAAPEVAAIVADMARVAPQPLAVRQICFEAKEVIVAPHPLTEPLRTLASAREERIPEAAAALHHAACALTACMALSA